MHLFVLFIHKLARFRLEPRSLDCETLDTAQSAPPRRTLIYSHAAGSTPSTHDISLFKLHKVSILVAKNAMNTEIHQATTFLARYLERKNVDAGKVETFQQKLTDLLTTRFVGHWTPGDALRGSAYRAIVIGHGTLDPILKQAASGIDTSTLMAAFPTDFIIWIDPGSVMYRSGGERGIIYTIWHDKSTPDFFAKATSNGIVIRSPSKEPSPNLNPQAQDSLSPPVNPALLNGGTWIDSQDTWEQPLSR